MVNIEATRAAIGPCPVRERAGLVRRLGDRMTQFGFKPRVIRDLLGRYPELRVEGE